MSVQERYWKELLQLKFEICYLDEYLTESYQKNNCINVITAIASSSSIAGWAIWNKFSFVWSFIIAISQVFNAIKIYFPFNKRIKTISNMCNDLSGLFIKAESNWFSIAKGDLTEKQINDLRFDIKKENQKIGNKYLSEIHLPKKENLKKVADSSTEQYFRNFYLAK